MERHSLYDVPVLQLQFRSRRRHWNRVPAKRRLGLVEPMPEPGERRGGKGGFPKELSPHFIDSQLDSTELIEPLSCAGEYATQSSPVDVVPVQ
jgi:hypothetical protein